MRDLLLAKRDRTIHSQSDSSRNVVSSNATFGKLELHRTSKQIIISADGCKTMSGYWARYQERQRKLATGVDADLLRDNRKHYRIGMALLVGGLGLILLTKYVLSCQIIARGMAVISGLSVIGGLVLLKFAQRERNVIDEPDPEKPPSILTPK